MKSLTCDVCKRKIEQPETDRTFFHYANRDLCEACKEDLELVIKPVIRDRQPFNYEWFDPFVREAIEEAIGRGSFTTR
ncbi:MAG: hypothetical protein LBQ35_00770 [Spirochaetaceae bacterium]|nr:hypothetical protein [Spirochaetaceae bacterium]